ncbi:MAG: PAS domain S-box protein, partial [Acidimicrobiales bacterium]
MVVYDDQFRFVAVNQAYEAFVQRPARELIGNLPDPDRYTFPNGGGQLARLLTGSADGCTTEVEVTRPDGTTAWATASGQAVREPDGTLTHVAMQLTDITRIRQTQLELRHRVEVGAAIRDASTALATDADDDLPACVLQLLKRVVSLGGTTTIVAAWDDAVAGGTVIAVGPGDDGALRAETTTGLPGDALLAVAEPASARITDVAGLQDWPALQLDIRAFGEQEADVGWLGATSWTWGSPLTSSWEPLTTFLEQAVHRSHRAAADRQRMILQAFINQTASEFLAHRFTGDRQEVLEHTLAGLAGLLDADNAQFRVVDWDRMVSETTAEYVAEGHSSTDDEFRVLDLNEPLYRDIAAGTEPISFEIAGMRGDQVSVLNVPLVVEGTTTATINISGPCGRRWADNEIEACRSIAGLMVQLQRRIDLERTLAQRLDLSGVVSEIATDFNEATAESAGTSVGDAVGKLASALDAPRIALWRHDRRARTASLEWMWEQGIGGKSFADIVRIDVTEHPDTADLFESTVPCTLG